MSKAWCFGVSVSLLEVRRKHQQPEALIPEMNILPQAVTVGIDARVNATALAAAPETFMIRDVELKMMMMMIMMWYIRT